MLIKIQLIQQKAISPAIAFSVERRDFVHFLLLAVIIQFIAKVPARAEGAIGLIHFFAQTPCSFFHHPYITFHSYQGHTRSWYRVPQGDFKF